MVEVSLVSIEDGLRQTTIRQEDDLSDALTTAMIGHERSIPGYLLENLLWCILDLEERDALHKEYALSVKLTDDVIAAAKAWVKEIETVRSENEKPCAACGGKGLEDDDLTECAQCDGTGLGE